jgi:UTP--glucose-1-phosphate uridylyltransferase
VTDVDFSEFKVRMLAAGLPTVVCKTFEHYYRELASGKTGLIRETEIEPVASLPDADEFPESLQVAGKAALHKTVMIKLNGGLGTGMGLDKAKSLLEVRDGLTFLDILARQTLASGARLLLMDSFRTQSDSLQALEKYPELRGEVPLDFLQHKVPKVVCSDLSPAIWPADPELEWCPPGHGDLYTALITTGMLETLLAAGIETAFVSNGDNLGAIIDPLILGYFVTEKLPFMMEVADRTAADSKGGHLARNKAGQLVLRESAQCAQADQATFQDIERHRYFNTNNLWIDLRSLRDLMAQRDNVLGLAMIRNQKTLDPRAPSSPKVYQLETAMGAAIEVFEGAGAIRVPRDRFAPVKKCSDLLALRSDGYALDEEYRVVLAAGACRTVVSLDDRFYKRVDDLEARFPHGPPSLCDCDKLTVQGDITFGRDVVIEGEAEVVNESDGPGRVPDGTFIRGRFAVPS